MSERARPTTYSDLRRVRPIAKSSSSSRARDPLTRRKRPRGADLHAEALDEPVPDRGRRDERDLLRGDRADEHLERIGDQRRAESGERRHELPQHVVAGRPGVERLEVEREPDERAHDGLGLRVERLGVDTARSRLDPQLAPADDPVQAALVPQARTVDAERAKALGAEREVERPGHGEERHARTVDATSAGV